MEEGCLGGRGWIWGLGMVVCRRGGLEGEFDKRVLLGFDGVRYGCMYICTEWDGCWGYGWGVCYSRGVGFCSCTVMEVTVTLCCITLTIFILLGMFRQEIFSSRLRNQIRSRFCNRVHGCLEVCCYREWHDAGVHHTEPLHAIHLTLGVNDLAHACSASTVEP